MSDVKISDLAAAAALTVAELIPLTQSSVTRSVTVTALKAFIDSGGTPTAGVFTTISSTVASGVGITANGVSSASLILATGTAGIGMNAATTDNTTASFGSFIASSPGGIAALIGHSSARTLSRYGVAIGGYAELCNQATTGLLIGSTTGTQPIIFGSGGSQYAQMTSTGLAVTGTLTTTDSVTVGLGSTAKYLLLPNANYVRCGNVAGTLNPRMLGINNADGAYIGPIDPGAVSCIVNGSSTSLLCDIYAAGSMRGSFSNSGLAVTGTLSATGNLALGGASIAGNINAGTGSGVATSYLQGGSAAAGGSAYVGQRAGSNSYALGDAGAILGGAETSDTVFYSYSTNNQRFYTSGVERMRIDASGNLGIGVTPSAWGTNYKVIEGAAAVTFAIASANANGTSLFSNLVGTNPSVYTYKTTNAASYLAIFGNTLSFATAASGTAGNTAAMGTTLQIGKGTALTLEGATSTAGTGIAFPATQLASSDANTLDDYEEGTFTPAIYGTTTAGAGTYITQSGKYTKVGNLVTFYAFCTWTAHTGTGNIGMNSLPFIAGGSVAPVLSVYASNLTYTGTTLQAYAPNGSALVTFEQTSNGAPTTGIPMDTSASLAVSGSYYIS